jgi:hypothetical protein
VIAVGSLVTWSGIGMPGLNWRVVEFKETYDGQPGATCDPVGQPEEYPGDNLQTLPLSELTLVGA